MIHRPVLTLYILIMLIKLCDLSLISHSTSAFSITSDPSAGSHALNSFSKSFSHQSFHNYSIFTIINQNEKTSVFVVCKNDTIIQLAIEDMKMVNIYRKNGCAYSSKYDCEESVSISLVSEITLFNQNMMWYCYVMPDDNYASPSLTNCLVPKNNVLPDDLKWTKTEFTSASNSHRTFSVQTDPYIFIGSYARNSLQIIRSRLPNILGKVDSGHDLTTPMAEFYFERYSHFQEVFSTEFEVYFVVSEPIQSKSQSISECVSSLSSSSSDQITMVSTRMIRICKDDLGGIKQFNEKNFGTAAKADLVCPFGLSRSNQYHFTRSISASWSGNKLYVLFESQKNSPHGKVLCVYDEFAFNMAFNSEMIQPTIFENLDKNQKVDNPIVDLCKKLSEKTLNEQEKTKATSMSANGLYRSKQVLPIGETLLMDLRNLTYNSISTFRLSKFDSSNIIVLIAENSVRLVSHMDDMIVCFIEDFHFDENEVINQVKGNNIEKRVYVHISTNKRMVQIELAVCERFLQKEHCLRKAPSICGWDSRQRRCTILTQDVDLSRWKRSSCKNIRVDDPWSLPERCKVKNRQETVEECSCRYCLQEQGCFGGKMVDVSDCSGPKKEERYGDWGSWSPCSSRSQNQKRKRECLTKTCTRAPIERRKCDESPMSASTTNWTKWFKSSNTNLQVSFRAKCSADRLLPPTLEERQMFCEAGSCTDESLQWSPWTECTQINIQYRLLNCSTIEGCPPSRIEVKQCAPKPRKYQQQPDKKENGYSVIHIVLAVLVVSLVWLIIVIVVSIAIFRYNFVSKKKTKRRKSERLLNTFSPPSYFRERSIFSATSNEYLSPNTPSTSYNPNLQTISFPRNITKDDIRHISNIYPRIPLNSDNRRIIH